MKPSRTMRFAAAGLLAGGVWTMAFAPVVEAIIGAPATPGSVAGVARRTARRTTAVVAVQHAEPYARPRRRRSGRSARERNGCVSSRGM